jgi:hypothetical protein
MYSAVSLNSWSGFTVSPLWAGMRFLRASNLSETLEHVRPPLLKLLRALQGRAWSRLLELVLLVSLLLVLLSKALRFSAVELIVDLSEEERERGREMRGIV